MFIISRLRVTGGKFEKKDRLNIKILFKCNHAVVYEVTQSISDVAYKGGYSISGKSEAHDYDFYFAERRLVKTPNYKELNDVADGESDKEFYGLFVKFTVGGFKDPRSVP